MFTWPQWIAVVALMLISFNLGYVVGYRISSGLVRYYRDLWIRKVDPNDPRFRSS